MKRIISTLLTLAVLCSVLSCMSFAAAGFTDVPESAWYYNDVNRAVELGLIGGKGNNRYAPEDNLTYAEAVKLAACMHKLTLEGSSEFGSDTVWYLPYVHYAKSTAIISVDYNWNGKITRADFLDIFSRALPEDKFPVINQIADGAIADVPPSYKNAGAIYKMYRAGIVAGSDNAHNCKPSTNIKRSEVAAILTRMMEPSARVSFTIELPEYRQKYNTGYDVYDAKIYEYYRAMAMSDAEFESTFYDDSSINAYMVKDFARGGGTIEYALYDVDKNGVPELIFLMGEAIIDVYTTKNGAIVKLFPHCTFGYRDILYILSNGAILNAFETGNMGYFEIFRINETGDKITRMGGTYYDNDGPGAFEEDFIYTTEQQYYEKFNSYAALSVSDSLSRKVAASSGEIQKENYYKEGIKYFNLRDYLTAAEQFTLAGDYSDAKTMVLECYYVYGKSQMSQNFVTEGVKYLSMCRGYKDTDEILGSYYYNDGVKAYNAFIQILSEKTLEGNITDAYERAVSSLSQCKGYKDADTLLKIAEKLYYAWSEIDSISGYECNLKDMIVTVSGTNIHIERESYMKYGAGDLVMDFDINKAGFTACISSMFLTRDAAAAKSVSALLTVFAGITNTEDFKTLFRDGMNWAATEYGKNFNISYGGYTINIDEKKDPNHYSSAMLEITVTK